GQKRASALRLPHAPSLQQLGDAVAVAVAAVRAGDVVLVGAVGADADRNGVLADGEVYQRHCRTGPDVTGARRRWRSTPSAGGSCLCGWPLGLGGRDDTALD